MVGFRSGCLVTCRGGVSAVGWGAEELSGSSFGLPAVSHHMLCCRSFLHCPFSQSSARWKEQIPGHVGHFFIGNQTVFNSVHPSVLMELQRYEAEQALPAPTESCQAWTGHVALVMGAGSLASLSNPRLVLLGDRNTIRIWFASQRFWFQLPGLAQLYPAKGQMQRQEMISC